MRLSIHELKSCIISRLKSDTLLAYLLYSSMTFPMFQYKMFLPTFAEVIPPLKVSP
jgi:hypothetical protein